MYDSPGMGLLQQEVRRGNEVELTVCFVEDRVSTWERRTQITHHLQMAVSSTNRPMPFTINLVGHICLMNFLCAAGTAIDSDTLDG